VLFDERPPGLDERSELVHELQGLAERYLERIIGRMIDINYHVLTESGQPPPPDYYPSFTALATIPEYLKRLAAHVGL
jgi:uncharacterized protein YutE (UPF0331/DUF86 family)